MNPSGPGLTEAWRDPAGRLSRTVVPRRPPGTSNPPTRQAIIVRAQQQSKPPQPLLTVLPRVIATGRRGRVRPSISMVSPTRACCRNSMAMRRMVFAGTSQIREAHSGEYSLTWATSFSKADMQRSAL